jgi:hypothetical protein
MNGGGPENEIEWINQNQVAAAQPKLVAAVPLHHTTEQTVGSKRTTARRTLPAPLCHVSPFLYNRHCFLRCMCLLGCPQATCARQ